MSDKLATLTFNNQRELTEEDKKRLAREALDAILTVLKDQAPLLKIIEARK